MSNFFPQLFRLGFDDLLTGLSFPHHLRHIQSVQNPLQDDLIVLLGFKQLGNGFPNFGEFLDILLLHCFHLPLQTLNKFAVMLQSDLNGFQFGN